MQVILREDVPSLGQTGETVKVRDGYGRNYLIPRGLAVIANVRNVAQAEHHKRTIAHQQLKRRSEAEKVKERLEQASINIPKTVGEEGKLFGSVTTREIVEALSAQGISVDRKAIHLDQPIRSLGVHSATVKLAPDVSAELKVWVVQK